MMQYSFVCNICGKEMQRPSKQHMREHFAEMEKNLEEGKTDVFQYFKMVFKTEWEE